MISAAVIGASFAAAATPETSAADLQWKPADVCRQGAFPLPRVEPTYGKKVVYFFVIQGTSEQEREDFAKRAKAAGLEKKNTTLELNGYEMALVTSDRRLKYTIDFRREYLAACLLRSDDRIYVGEIRHGEDGR